MKLFGADSAVQWIKITDVDDISVSGPEDLVKPEETAQGEDSASLFWTMGFAVPVDPWCLFSRLKEE